MPSRTENWRRPRTRSRPDGSAQALHQEDLDEFVANNVRLRIIGDYKAIRPDIVELIDEALARRREHGTTLAVALNYGSQDEIARAAAKAAAKGAITPEAIEAELDTADLPPLDLLIRTSGEVAPVELPAVAGGLCRNVVHRRAVAGFQAGPSAEALEEFARRERRYGGR
jgi:undecaprenyl diphosphate synthase